MLALACFILLVIATIYVTYPEEFPELISDPGAFLRVMNLETQRRWMILKLGSRLWVEKRMMAYSLWKMKDIIKSEQLKQQQQPQHQTTDDR